MTQKEIDEHPLLTSEQKLLARSLLRASKKGREFVMLDFAKVALRAQSRDYGEASEQSYHDEKYVARLERELYDAAILYVYEALRSRPQSFITATKTIEALELLKELAKEKP